MVLSRRHRRGKLNSSVGEETNSHSHTHPGEKQTPNPFLSNYMNMFKQSPHQQNGNQEEYKNHSPQSTTSSFASRVDGKPQHYTSMMQGLLNTGKSQTEYNDNHQVETQKTAFTRTDGNGEDTQHKLHLLRYFNSMIGVKAGSCDHTVDRIHEKMKRMSREPNLSLDVQKRYF